MGKIDTNSPTAAVVGKKLAEKRRGVLRKTSQSRRPRKRQPKEE